MEVTGELYNSLRNVWSLTQLSTEEKAERRRKPHSCSLQEMDETRVGGQLHLQVQTSARGSSFYLWLIRGTTNDAQALEILDPEEVEYIRTNATATVGDSVTLDCGSTMPTIFIWGFTKPGTDNNVAVAYNYGQGPKLQAQSSSLGHMLVPVNTSALVIEELQRDAEGMYTCQALYDTDEGTRITFYFTRLDVDND
ncbi:hypothetical protein NQZ68_013079 [Dissostichus eleginoides]|nr:hypothetical protein NQZ68_013079 [Dissostichus eleginoides]